jgi:hypothetical protein
MTPLIAWIGLGLFTAGFVNRYFQHLVRDQPRDVRLIVWAITILGTVLLWPIPFGILIVLCYLAYLPIFWHVRPIFWRNGVWTLLPSLSE